MQCLLVLCLSLLASQVCAVEYWMRPNHIVSCPPGVDCITLSDMIVEPSRYNVSNLTIHLLPGIHSPNQSNWITIKTGAYKSSSFYESEWRNWNWSFVGHPNHCDEFHCDVVIECKSYDLGLAIIGMGNVSFTNLLVKRCGLLFTESLNTYIVTQLYSDRTYVPKNDTRVRAAIVIMEVVVLSIENVHITESKGYGLLAVRPAIRTTIHKCSFKYNNWKTNDLAGGNVYFLYTIQSGFYFSNELSINYSTVSYGKSRSTRPVIRENIRYRFLGRAGSGGLTIGFLDRPLTVNVSISNSNFSENYANFGANMNIYHFQVNMERYLPLIIIENCTFTSGYATLYGGGLHVETHHTLVGNRYSINARHRRLKLIIIGSTFQNNHAKYGGGIAVQHGREKEFRHLRHILIADYIIENPMAILITRCTFHNNTAGEGGGLYHHSIHKGSKYHITSFVIKLTSTKFTNNTAKQAGGGLYIGDKNYGVIEPHHYHPTEMWFQLNSCNFTGNVAKIGSAISIISQTTSKSRKFGIYGSRFNHDGGLSLSSGVIYLEQVENITIANIEVTNNQATGLYINASRVCFLGNNNFISNTAQQGAAIFLDCTPSQFVLFDTTAIHIISNKATTYGGGIAVKDGCSSYTSCFFQLGMPELQVRDTPLVFMQNNTAGIAGNEIYGGNLEYCHFSDGSLLAPLQFRAIFQMDGNSLSATVSQAYRVCICTHHSAHQNCTHNLQVHTYPGQQFHVPAVGTGQLNNPSPSVIRAEVHAPVGYTAQLGERQTSQDTHTQCKNLTYSIQTRAKTVTIKLSLERPLFNFPTIESALISVTVLECPFGFELVDTSSDQPACDCVPHFKEQGVKCDINTQTIQREPSMWIGNFADDIVLHHNCPFDYCKQEEQDLDLNTQSTQCNFNRTGVLCGACQPGLSLALGTSQCLDCSNTYLLLLIPFAVAGVVLVVLLLKCNLTVSTGTLNGLIFYANIVQASRSIFFPVKGTKYLSYFLSIFIAWLNLDFGFEVCFMNSLDAYTRTWFQFLFPLYIWILVALLILVSTYSITVSRMTGSNTVSVLATLFLLSYAKLLRTTLKVFSFANLTDRNGTDTSVWLLDGNYSYKQWPHTALFIAALVNLLAHLLPFTFLLSLAPFLQKYSYYTVLRWIFKFKPLLDAYQGPYKVKFRWWTGLMLLLRLFLFSVFATNALGDPRVNLLTTELVVLLLLITWLKFPRVYRKASVNILEIFFILNLGVYAAAVQYVKGTTEEEKLLNIISCCMVGSAFVVFLLILAYHCYTALSNTHQGRKLVDKVKLLVRARRNKDTEKSAEIPVQVQQPTVSYVAMKDLRESLLTES